MIIMLVSKPPPERMTGTCQMCGRHNQELTLTAFWEYVGFTCKYCVTEIRKENMGRIRAATEHTEPAE